MSDSPHRLLLASAGTGKTYQLTGRYLSLCLRHVDPARVLATTFTRKAAGEIADRVLERLVEGAGSEEALAAVRAQVELSGVTREDCVALLAQLARGLDRLQIRTLDSFFAHVARLFAFDLSMPPDWRIADEREDAELRAEAVARVLEDAGADERLELLRALQRDAGARRVNETLLRVVKEVRAEARDCAAGAWEVVRAPEGLGEERLAAIAATLEDMQLPETKAGKPRANWVKNQRKLLDGIAAADWAGLLEVGLVKKVLEGESSFDREPIGEELRALLDELLRHVAAEEIGALARRNAAAREFLERYDARITALQREAGAYRFDDLPPALVSLGQRVDELWYRLDGRIDHLLLDEFQDTAPLQWRVLEPIASELAADGTGEETFFCVGDVKQSIYGWRSAEPRLLANLDRHLPGLVAVPMVKSFRSSPVVLDTVDRVFTDVAASPVLADEDQAPLRAAAARWCDGYLPHEAAKERPGAAVLYQASRAREGEPHDLPPLRLTVERVVALRAEAPDMEIGVLVRRNKRIPWLIERLRERGVLASGEGGNPLTDSDAVLTWLALLHLADHPGDTAAALHVASSPFGAELGLPLAELEARAADVSRALRVRLLREGHGGLASAFAPLVDAATDRWGEWDRRRFARLVDLAHAYDARAGLRPTAFAQHVRETRVEEPSATGVRVMTVHASKGLEFEAVLCPELDVALCPGRHALLVRRGDPYGPVDAITLPPRKALAQLDPTLRELREHAQGRDLEESLSVLYVAMTRAARRLELIVRHPETRGNAGETTFAGLLRHALGSGDGPGAGEETDEDGALWRHERSSDERGWCAADEVEAPAPPETQPTLALAPAAPRAALRARSPSAEEERGARASALLRARDEAATRHGSLVHRWLEELEWLDDFERDDEELLALGARIEPDRAKREEALRSLRAALAGDEVRAALSRPESSREYAVERERRFALYLPTEDGAGEEYWHGSVDRLVIEREGDRAVAAEVLDYKTDRVDAAGVTERAESYRPQLEAYRRVAARLTDLPEDAVRARLLFLGPGVAVEL